MAPRKVCDRRSGVCGGGARARRSLELLRRSAGGGPGEHGRAGHQRDGARGSEPDHIERLVVGDAADDLLVPVGAVRVRRRRGRRLELLLDLRCDGEDVHAQGRRRRIPAPGSGNGDEQLRGSPSRVQPDGDDCRTEADERRGTDDRRLGRRKRNPPGEPWVVDRPADDHVRLPLAPLRHLGQRLPGHQRRNGGLLRRSPRRRRPHRAGAGHRPERRRLARLRRPPGPVSCSRRGRAVSSTFRVESARSRSRACRTTNA